MPQRPKLPAGAVWFAGAMGLLDDAIREHLELKRLRGADPGSVAREGEDALGPVNREVEAAQGGSPDVGAEVPSERRNRLSPAWVSATCGSLGGWSGDHRAQHGG